MSPNKQIVNANMSLHSSGVQFDWASPSSVWEDTFRDVVRESTLLEEDFLTFTTTEFEKDWKESSLEAQLNLFPPWIKMSQESTNSELDFFDTLDTTEFDNMDFDNFNYNWDENLLDFGKLAQEADQETQPVYNALSDINVYPLKFGQDQSQQLENNEPGTPIMAQPEIEPKMEQVEVMIPEQSEDFSGGPSEPSLAQANRRSSSRRKAPVVVRNVADSPAPPAPEPVVKSQAARGRKKAETTAMKSPKRRTKTEKIKKPKQWQNPSDPKNKDSYLARVRREAKKTELADTKAERDALKEDLATNYIHKDQLNALVATNYIHKDDGDALVQRVMELGLGMMAGDVQDQAFAVADKDNSADVDASTG